MNVIKSRGVTYVNVTPHPITLAWPDGEEFEVPPSGILINAKPEEVLRKVLRSFGPDYAPTATISFVETHFVPDGASEMMIEAITEEHPGAIIIGSIIAAQAFPDRVVAMVPVPGFERVPPVEKKMRTDKFTVF